MKKTLFLGLILSTLFVSAQIDKYPVNVDTVNGKILKRKFVSFFADRDLEYIRVFYDQWKEVQGDADGEKLSFVQKNYVLKNLPAWDRFTQWYSTTSLDGLSLGDKISSSANFVLKKLPENVEDGRIILPEDLQ